MEEEEARQISKYNTAFFINERLNTLWTDANVHSRTGAFNKWNLDLDAIWRELARDFKPKKEKKENKTEDDSEFKEYEKKFNEFSEKLSKFGMLTNSDNLLGFKRITLKDIHNRNQQYEILNNKELFLKRLENKLGKGTKFQDEDEDMM